MQVGGHKSRFWSNSLLSIDDCCSARSTSATVHRAQTATHQWIYVYHSQHGRPRRREENSIYLYAAVNLKRNLRSTYCTTEANDRHEASRSFSATAALLQTRKHRAASLQQQRYFRHESIARLLCNSSTTSDTKHRAASLQQQHYFRHEASRGFSATAALLQTRSIAQLLCNSSTACLIVNTALHLWWHLTL